MLPLRCSLSSRFSLLRGFGAPRYRSPSASAAPASLDGRSIYAIDPIDAFHTFHSFDPFHAVYPIRPFDLIDPFHPLARPGIVRKDSRACFVPGPVRRLCRRRLRLLPLPDALVHPVGL